MLAGSKRFYEILKELGDLHAMKQQDYGTDADPFANIRAGDEWGIRPWVNAMSRATDKVRRIQRYAERGHLANESVEDSFRDLAVHTIIALVLWEEVRDSLDEGIRRGLRAVHEGRIRPAHDVFQSLVKTLECR